MIGIVWSIKVVWVIKIVSVIRTLVYVAKHVDQRFYPVMVLVDYSSYGGCALFKLWWLCIIQVMVVVHYSSY
jgi:hypothetical protein